MQRWLGRSPAWRAFPRRMANVVDVNFATNDAVEDKIAEPRYEEQQRVRFVRFSSFVRVIFERPRKLSNARDDTRRRVRIVLADVSMDL